MVVARKKALFGYENSAFFAAISGFLAKKCRFRTEKISNVKSAKRALT